MAASAPHSANAFSVEVARYLSVDPKDVQHLIQFDKLPVIRIPSKTRTVIRVPLRDFHAWLLARTQNPTPKLASYTAFLADFDASARALPTT